jgi:cytoskeleton protein RodZ
VVAESPPAAAGEVSGLAPHAGLRVEFDDRSWIEVRDATQKIVFVGEYPAGTLQNIEGKAPFQLWIGRASSVRVFMAERSIDLKPHTREDVARFTLE